jgi:hypothetical protein
MPTIALTGSRTLWPGKGRVVLLVCEGCGEEGCWPFLARVHIGDEVVSWDGFEQPHRPERDYSELQFSFDRGQYDSTLTRAFSS